MASRFLKSGFVALFAPTFLCGLGYAAEVVQPHAAPVVSGPAAKTKPLSKVPQAAGSCPQTPTTKDFIAKLKVAAQTIPAKDQINFVCPTDRPDMKTTLSKALAIAGDYVEDDGFSTSAAASKPIPLQIGCDRNHHQGSMIVWKNQVFPSDFFALHHDRWEMTKGKTTAGLLNEVGQVPWMKWENCSLKYSPTGGGAEILALLKESMKPGEKLKLYRGTTPLESLFLDLNKKALANAPYNSNWVHDLKATLDSSDEAAKSDYNAALKNLQIAEKPSDKQHYGEIVQLKKAQFDKILKNNNDLLAVAGKVKDNASLIAFVHGSYAKMMVQGSFQGIFTTPDLERAKTFSKGKIVSFEISQSDLDAALAKKSLYIGFENQSDDDHIYSAMELGFLSDGNPASTKANVDKLMSSYTGSQDAAAGAVFN